MYLCVIITVVFVVDDDVTGGVVAVQLSVLKFSLRTVSAENLCARPACSRQSSASRQTRARILTAPLRF